jgi:hypothetical protein
MTSSEERAIASKISQELCEALGPAMPPEELMTRRDLVCETFTRVFDDQHGIVDESSAVRILGRVSKALAKNFKAAEVNRQHAAMRPTVNESKAKSLSEAESVST